MKLMPVLFVLFVAGSALAQLQRNPGDTGSLNLSATHTGSWQTQTTGITEDTLHAVSVVDGNVCWLAGGSGKIIRTLDGGNTWSPLNSGIIGTQNIYAFEAVSDSSAFAVTTVSDSGTFIYRTTNSSSSWELVSSQPAGFIFAIKILSPTRGIAVGDPIGGRWMILKTTNSGGTWFRIPTEPLQISGASGGTGFGALDTTYVWFFDNTGRHYWSNNGGETWSYSSDPGPGTNLYWWNTRNLALDVTPMIVLRYEFGWLTVGPPPNLLFPLVGLVGAIGTREFWLVQDAIYYTSNAGTSWTNAPPNGLNKPVALIDMITLGSEVSAWATGIGDTIYHYNGIVTGVDESPQPIPREFSLSQNYPNPFNPSTTLGFEIPVSVFVTLKIYNMLGQEVATLVNEMKQVGRYEVTWNSGGQTSGVYFYRLQSGEFLATKKLVMIR